MAWDDEYIAVMIERLRIATELVFSACQYSEETKKLGQEIIMSIEKAKDKIK